VYLGWIVSRFKCVWVKSYLGLSAIIKFGVIRSLANQDLADGAPVRVWGVFIYVKKCNALPTHLILWGYVQHVLLGIRYPRLYVSSLGPEFIRVSVFSVHKYFYNMVVK